MATITKKKAQKILREGIARNKPLTKAQKRFFHSKANGDMRRKPKRRSRLKTR